MQKTDGNQLVMNAHRRVKSSTTLNRKYVKRPENSRPEKNVDGMTATIKKSAKIRHFNGDAAIKESGQAQQAAAKAVADQTIEVKQLAAASAHPLQKSANARLKQRQGQVAQAQAKKLTAKELKDRAIIKALAEASSQDKSATSTKPNKIHFGFPRIALALSCTAVVVFMIVYFVNLNMPDISLRVAAMQTGFEATYPSYIPREYALSGITSEGGNIILNFRNQAAETAFALTEEKSTWDSGALLNNYVKPTYGENYSVIREQGLTIYVSGSNAAWVNGGIVYKLQAGSNNLTKKQIKSIAVSL